MDRHFVYYDAAKAYSDRLNRKSKSGSAISVIKKDKDLWLVTMCEPQKLESEVRKEIEEFSNSMVTNEIRFNDFSEAKEFAHKQSQELKTTISIVKENHHWVVKYAD